MGAGTDRGLAGYPTSEEQRKIQYLKTQQKYNALAKQKMGVSGKPLRPGIDDKRSKKRAPKEQKTVQIYYRLRKQTQQ